MMTLSDFVLCIKVHGDEAKSIKNGKKGEFIVSQLAVKRHQDASCCTSRTAVLAAIGSKRIENRQIKGDLRQCEELACGLGN